MSTTDAKKSTKARQPRASALKSTSSRKTTKPKTLVNEPVSVAYASKYTVGDNISHSMFGHGTVTAIDENKLTIEFPESVTKQIIDAYVTRRSPRHAPEPISQAGQCPAAAIPNLAIKSREYRAPQKVSCLT